jgi:hypothetical protein
MHRKAVAAHVERRRGGAQRREIDAAAAEIEHQRVVVEERLAGPDIEQLVAELEHHMDVLDIGPLQVEQPVRVDLG